MVVFLRRFLLFVLFFNYLLPIQGQDDLYDISKIQEVKISIDDPHWDNRLNAYKKQGLSKRLIGKVQVNGITYDSVGIRYKGNSSYFNTRKIGSSKLPFNIKINYVRDEQLLPGGFKTLKLSNVFRDPSFLREVLSYEVATKYMVAPRANFAKVYVNDVYFGLYNLSESVDHRFLKAHYGWSKGTLVKCDPAWKAKGVSGCPVNEKATLKYLGADSVCYLNSYELKSKSGWGELVGFTKSLDEKKPEELEEILNVDAVLWMLAFDNALVNLDSYLGRLCHNYYMYRDSTGRFNPIIWDMNMSFGGFRFDGTGKSLSDTEMKRLSPLLHFKNKNPDRPLITKLLDYPLYRKIYIAHLRTINEENFSNEVLKKRAKEIHQQIAPHVQSDTNKLYAYEGFIENLEKTAAASTSKIIGLFELMDAREEYLSNHPLLTKIPPTITAVKHETTEEGIVIAAKVTNTENVWLYHRSENIVFQSVPMEQNGDLFTAVLPDKPAIQYYLVAENKDAAMLSPKRAAHEFHTIE